MKLLMALALLLQITAPPVIKLHPNPSLEKIGDITYWHCPQGFGVSYRYAWSQEQEGVPICMSSHLAKAIDASTQELIFWRWTKLIPENGVLESDWSSFRWVAVPGCEIHGDDNPHLSSSPERTMEHITVRGKPKQKLFFDCEGVAWRK